MAAGTVCAIFGSPHRHGFSAALHQQFLTEHDFAGITRFYCHELNIAPCTGCDVCRQAGVCIHDDDYAGVMTAMLASDIISISWPLYFGGVPSPLKALIDRTQLLWNNRQMVPPGTPRPAYLFVTGGNEYRDMFDCSLRMVRFFLKTFNAETDQARTRVLSSTDNKKPGSI
jgi:multimeric flavodoxin WrbA